MFINFNQNREKIYLKKVTTRNLNIYSNFHRKKYVCQIFTEIEKKIYPKKVTTRNLIGDEW